MKSVPFCVVEKPYMVWGYDVEADNVHFLERVDAELYYRTAHNIIANEGAADFEASPAGREDDDQDRKDVSSLSRLLWHHGMETLVMMLGALIQAPSAAHAYFLKCKTEDAAAMAGHLLREDRPKYNRLNHAPFTLVNLLNGIHLYAGWDDRDAIVERFARAFGSMLHAYASEQHRWEYNSIKHGLRASHGRFGLAVGVEELPGVPAPIEAMQMVGYSRDASFFDVAKPLRNATTQASKIHFRTEKVGVSWSLEKVVCELQLLSILLHNTVAALRIVAGAKPGSVTFNRIVEADPFWEAYFSLHAGNVPHASIADEIDAKNARLPDKKHVFDSYMKSNMEAQ